MFKHSLGKHLTKFKPVSETGFGTESEQHLAGNFNPSSALSDFLGKFNPFSDFFGKFNPFLLHSVNNPDSDSDFFRGEIHPSLSLLSSLACLFCTFFFSLSSDLDTLFSLGILQPISNISDFLGKINPFYTFQTCWGRLTEPILMTWKQTL